MKKFTLSEIPPVDLLDAARTIRIGHVDCCDWAPRWAPAQTFLEWAHRGLEDGGGYGLSNAIGYAKQTVACRIDGILRSYRVRALERANYPAKIDVLNELGVSIPQIIKELVIDPRNEVEHKYQMPTRQAARQAIEIAELLLRATEAESTRPSIVAVNWNVLGGLSWNGRQHHVTFDGFSNEPMLLIDVFDSPNSVKIVDPLRDEIRWASLASFDKKEALQLARLLRANYACPNGFSVSQSDPIFFRETKRLGGF